MRKLSCLLLLLATGLAQADSTRCSVPGVDFEIKNQNVTFFYARSAVSGQELANGYTLTCVYHLGKFSQSKKENGYVLSLNDSNGQFGESKDCKVHIADIGQKYHLYTSNCVSECMKFNHKMEKVGNECQVIK